MDYWAKKEVEAAAAIVKDRVKTEKSDDDDLMDDPFSAIRDFVESFGAALIEKFDGEMIAGAIDQGLENFRVHYAVEKLVDEERERMAK